MNDVNANKRILMLVITMVMFVSLFAGCGGEKSDAESGQKSDAEMAGTKPGVTTEPETPAVTAEPEKSVTVKFHVTTSYMSDEDLQLLVAGPLKQKYPYITVERVTGDITKMVASGDIPDLIVTHNGIIQQYTNVTAKL